MEHNRSKKTKTVRTLIETNGERYEIQYEVGENEIDSIAQAQALQLFIDNYAATQTKNTQFQPQHEVPQAPQHVQEQILIPEEECILPDVPEHHVLGQYAAMQQQRQSVIHIDESDEEKDDVKPDVKFVPPPPPADPDDLEAQISASVILVDEFKNAKMPANCSTNDSNSRSTRLSKEELEKVDSNVSFSNAYKAFAVNCPDAISPQFKQKFNDKKRRFNWPCLTGQPSKPDTNPDKSLTPQTQAVVTSTITTPVQQSGTKGTPLPKITTVWSAKTPVHSTNVTHQPVNPAVVPPLAAPLPQKVRRQVAPTPNITVTMSPATLMSDPNSLLTVQSTKTLEQLEQEESAKVQRFHRSRGRPVKRHIEPPPSSIKTSVITSVPKVEKPDVPVVTYQTVAAPSPPVVAQTSQQTFSLNQPTAVCIDGQYYLLQAVPNESTQPAQTSVQQINQAIQPIVAQSLQPFLQQHQQQQLQPQQVYQHMQTVAPEQPAQDMYRNAPIMIVNQPNFHISSNTPTPVSATVTSSSNNASASQTIILTDEQYNNYLMQHQQQTQQQAHPVPLQLHQNPMSYTNQQQTQVIVRPVRGGGQKTTKNLVVAGTEDLQFIEYQDLMNDVNSVSKKYY